MTNLPEILLQISTYFVSAGIILATLRLIKGPSMADRVVALDTFTVISISLITLIACISGRVIFLDVGMVYKAKPLIPYGIHFHETLFEIDGDERHKQVMEVYKSTGS